MANANGTQDILHSPITLGAGVGILSSFAFLSTPSWLQILGFGLLGGVGSVIASKYLAPGQTAFSNSAGFQPSAAKQAIQKAQQVANSGSAGAGAGGLKTPLGSGFLSDIFKPRPARPDDNSLNPFPEIELEAPRAMENPTSTPSPSPSPAPASQPVQVNTTGLMTPEQAANLIKQGQYSTVRAGKMSQTLKWGDFFRGMPDSGMKDAAVNDLTAMRHGYENANTGLALAARILGVSAIYPTGATCSGFRNGFLTCGSGAKHSSHKLGNAFDCKVPAGYTAYSAFVKLVQAGWPGDLGWNPYGAGFLHIAYRPNPYNNNIPQRWTYTSGGAPKYTGVFKTAADQVIKALTKPKPTPGTI